MTVQQLIDELQKCENKDVEVVIHTPRMDWYDTVAVEVMPREPAIMEGILVLEASSLQNEGKYAAL